MKFNRKDLNSPWKNCPTIWKSFFEEMVWNEDEKIVINSYRNNDKVLWTKRNAEIPIKIMFEIFYYGFLRGGNS